MVAELADPFTLPPQPLAVKAAEELMEGLAAGLIAPGFPTSLLDRPEGGKMFGVLVTQARDGSVRTLRAFSGQLGDVWDVPGFSPPLFDAGARAAIQVPAEARIKALTAELALPDDVEVLARAHARVAELEVRRRVLAQETSTAARLERRALRAEQDGAERPVRRLRRRRAARERLRTCLSRKMVREIPGTYLLSNRLGESTNIRALFAPRLPSWGTGDCAAPKLLMQAFREDLTPLALAEFFWGPPPRGGGRLQGQFYPPCETKCRPLLAFLVPRTR